VRLATYEQARTILLLLRYFRTALMTGRMPSLLGREIFRPDTSLLPSSAFEEAVLFVCDVERCLRALAPFDQRLIAVCILEERSEWQAARLLRCNQMDVCRRLMEVLDLLHDTFCRTGLLPKPFKKPAREPVEETTPAKGEQHESQQEWKN
jgi:hypothetical protein